MIRFLRPFQFAMPHLVPVTAKIMVHSDDVVERETPDGTKYLDSMRKIAMQPVRILWCLAFGAGANERVTARYSGESLVEVRGGACDVLSRSVPIPDVEDGAVAEVRITAS
jgi:hypothetical protein